MTIFFGLSFDDLVFPQADKAQGGFQYRGPVGLLHTLESFLGLTGHAPDNEYLRIEQYRQSLRNYLQKNEDAFFLRSFEADQFATAAELLSRRDELLLSGWNFAGGPGCPSRLQCLATIEHTIQIEDKLELAAGFADRFCAVLEQIGKRRHPLRQLIVNEPTEWLPPHFQRLLDRLKKEGVQVLNKASGESAEPGSNDLGRFRQLVLHGKNGGKKDRLKADGSLLIIRGKRETDLAAYLAKMLRANPKLRPAFLIPDKNRAIDNALIQEGLPSMGIASASLARPTLQVLKLVPVFLWNPIDPFKIMEFVSLAVKPLEAELANRIAEQIARTPGLKGEGWYITINRYFEEMTARAQADPEVKVEDIRRQYNFWFERKRYDISGAVPKEEVIDIFSYLKQWAARTFDEESAGNQSLQVLREQAKRIVELLEALPESQLTNLELERIVRTIYEPAPVQFTLPECGHPPYVHHPASFAEPADSLLWWNFISKEKDHFFSRWYRKERAYLTDRNIALQGPAEENELLIWQRKRPLIQARQQLLLAIPEMIEGKEVHAHPLSGDLEAAFSNLDDISLNIDTDKRAPIFDKLFSLPEKTSIAPRQLGQPKPFLDIRAVDKLGRRDEETFSSLESLFYYPYQWVFRHKIRLRKSSILSIVKDVTLLGNLAHRFFERLLKQDITNWDYPQIDTWIDQEARSLLSREGAVLLMYGREPERIHFIQRVKYAARSLVHLIQRNGWRVLETEKPMEGAFLNMPVNGRADLVLERNGELAVVDFKWRGASRRERIIRNEEDLQLVLYASLLTDDQQWAHTAYYIMESGKMIARNNLAFDNITAIDPDADHREVNQRIMDKMEATFHWRMQQIGRGQIEIRCEQTCKDLEDHYGAQLLDLLEMKTEDAPFDDYRTLINLVR